MARVIRGNRELTVADTDVRAYLEDGYALIDDKGNVIQPSGGMTYEDALRRIAYLEERLRVTTLELENTRRKCEAKRSQRGEKRVSDVQ